MTFLPIVDRELRETSRRAATYWLRCRVAFLSILVGGIGYGVNFIYPPLKLGTFLFWGLSGVSMLFCLFAGRRSTADCLSQEKREGTLGLLFLTDLKGYDVVFGKMVGTSISAFYALLTILPVTAVALLAGGVAKGELWRMALVLVNAFFLSLAIGIFASSVSRQYRTAMATNFYVMLMVMGVATVLTFVYKAAPEPLKYSSPIYTFMLCSERVYNAQVVDFWRSLAATHAIAWMLTALACWIVPRTWGDKQPKPAAKRRSVRELARTLNYGSREKCVEFRKRALDINAYFWMAAKARLKPAQVWAFLFLAGVWWADARWRGGVLIMNSEILISAGLVINGTLRLWILTEAGQAMFEDRKGGTFELILVTPQTVRDIVRGQWLALRRQFLWPLVVVTLVELEFMRRLRGSEVYLFGAAGLIVLWADSAAIGWVAMNAAMRQKTQTKALVFTLTRILIFPWALFTIAVLSIELLREAEIIHWDLGERAAVCLWLGLSVGLDLVYGAAARWRLLKDFRSLALPSAYGEPPRQPVREFLKWFWRAIIERMARRIPARCKKLVLATGVAGAVLAVVMLVMWLFEPGYPSAVEIALLNNNGPLRVFPGGDSGVFFILPDGSLWQWGKPGAPQSKRSAAPEQVGEDRDWEKVVAAGTHCVGLRTNGTLWAWGFSLGLYFPEPFEFNKENDWTDVGVSAHSVIAVNRGGRAWAWSGPLVGDAHETNRRASYLGDRWLHVHGEDTPAGLRTNGTLWIVHSANAVTRVGAASNWVAIEPDGLCRNRDGELFGPIQQRAGLGYGADVGGLVSKKTPGYYRQASQSAWLRAEIHGNGTLWGAQGSPGKPAGAATQLGKRQDWVAVWTVKATGFGMTADGTVWTWGQQFDKDPVRMNGSFLSVLRYRWAGARLAFPAGASAQILAVCEKPRPLFKMEPLSTQGMWIH